LFEGHPVFDEPDKLVAGDLRRKPSGSWPGRRRVTDVAFGLRRILPVIPIVLSLVPGDLGQFA
jgi:hypothetical protein